MLNRRPTVPWWVRHFGKDSLVGYSLGEKTTKEVSGILQMLRLSKPKQILDLCCGNGRHAITFAQRGHRVVGLDWSKELLDMARTDADRQGVPVTWIRQDMRRLHFHNRFDIILNLFTSFGYFDSVKDDLAVLRGVQRALKPGGIFLIDLLNRDWLIRHFTPRFWQREAEGNFLKALSRLSFNPLTSRLKIDRTLHFCDGRKKETRLDFKVYPLHELVGLIETAGMRFKKTYGGFDLQEYSPDSFRMILVAHK